MLRIAAAVPQELAHVRARGDFGIVLTGVGFARARAAVGALLAGLAPGDWVLSTGYCGALDRTFPRGQVVVYEVVQVEGEAAAVPLDVEPALTAALGGKVRRVRAWTAPRIVNGTEERERLRREADAEVVDMETGILAGACRAAGIRCAAVRVVLDTPAEPMRVDYGSIPTPAGHLRPADVVRWLLLHPWRLFALLADRAAAAQAARSIGPVVERAAAALAAAGASTAHTFPHPSRASGDSRPPAADRA